MRLKRQWAEFKQIALDKGLQIFIGEARSDYYHLLAIDDQITYESIIQKNNGLEQLDYEQNYKSSITNKVSTNPDWDSMTATLTSPAVEVQTYTKNGAVVQTVSITYTSPSKNFIESIQRVRA